MAEKIPVREGVFIDSPEGGILLSNKCESCGQVYFPKVDFCLSCFNDEMKEIELSRQGELYSYTIGHLPSMHFQPPYAVGYVDMPEGVRVFAPLKMVEDKPLVVGMEMEVVVEKLWDEKDKEIIGYKFRPL